MNRKGPDEFMDYRMLMDRLALHRPQSQGRDPEVASLVASARRTGNQLDRAVTEFERVAREVRVQHLVDILA